MAVAQGEYSSVALSNLLHGRGHCKIPLSLAVKLHILKTFIAQWPPMHGNLGCAAMRPEQRRRQSVHLMWRSISPAHSHGLPHWPRAGSDLPSLLHSDTGVRCFVSDMTAHAVHARLKVSTITDISTAVKPDSKNCPVGPLRHLSWWQRTDALAGGNGPMKVRRADDAAANKRSPEQSPPGTPPRGGR
jgi:hypothetical protein